jgi:Tol biopolymer transport system component
VKAGGTELGHADILLYGAGKGAKNMATGDVFGLLDGRTLPIKFRIEQGAVAVLGATGGTGVFESGAVSVAFTAGALPHDTGITVTAIPGTSPAATDLSIISGTLYEFQPSPITFAQPVDLSLRFPSSLPIGVKAERLAVCKMTEGVCVPVGRTKVNLATSTATAGITSFSEYGVTPFPEMCYSTGAFSYEGQWLHTDSGDVRIRGCDGEWSPDGSQLLYDPSNGSYEELRIMRADGSADRHVAGGPGEQIWSECGQWSPDGTKLVFGRTFVNGSPMGLVISNTDGSSQRSIIGSHYGLSVNSCAWWGGSNTSLVFSASDSIGSSGLWSINADGTQLHKLIDAETIGENGWFAASADGSRVAFVATWAGNLLGQGVYEMNRDGTNLRFVAQFGGVGNGWGPLNSNGYFHLEWSPIRGDNRLLFSSPGENGYGELGGLPAGIYIASNDGADLQRIFEGHPQDPNMDYRMEYHPAYARWSPDARRISVEWLDGPFSDGRTTYLMNADGTGISLLVAPPLDALQVRWRP